MTPEEQMLMAPLVDVQPAWNMAIVAATPPNAYYTPETIAFARMKVKEAIRIMREAATGLERRIKTSAEQSGEGSDG